MADENKPTPKRKVSRRALFGWCVSAGAAALFVGIFTSIHNALSDIPALTFWKSRRTGHAGRERAKSVRIIRKVQTARGVSNPDLVLVENRSPSRELKTSVVHWPHPSLFGRRPILNTRHRVLKNDDWKNVVKPRCSGTSLEKKRSTTHFDARRDAVIREHLALAKVSFESGNSPRPNHGVDEALAILAPIFDDDRNRCNWRAYHLYSRLVCLNETDPEQARGAILKATWNRPESEPKPDQLRFLSSAGAFSLWHKKCSTFREFQRLRRRVEFSKSLRGGQSSSGQDTAFAERDRSNRPRPLANRKSGSVRQKKLERRKIRRGARKRVTFWHRITVLWNRARLSNQSPRTDQELNPHENRHRKIRHSRRCPVSKRGTRCLPLKEKPRFFRIRGGKPFGPK